MADEKKIDTERPDLYTLYAALKHLSTAENQNKIKIYNLTL